MSDPQLEQVARELEVPADALENVVLGVAALPTVSWLFESLRQLCEEILPRSMVELRSRNKPR